MAGHTGNAGFDALIGPARVGDNFGSALFDPPALSVHQHIRLQTVGKMIDDLPAGRLKRDGAALGPSGCSKRFCRPELFAKS